MEIGMTVDRRQTLSRLLLGISFFNPTTPIPPKVRGRRGFDAVPQRSLAPGPGWTFVLRQPGDDRGKKDGGLVVLQESRDVA
jgi:hypothetical protein